MPRRLPVRPAKVFGNFFVLLVLSVIALIYYTFVFVVWGPRADSKYRIFSHIHESFSQDLPMGAIQDGNGLLIITTILNFEAILNKFTNSLFTI